MDREFYENHVSESGVYVNGQWMKSHQLYQSDSPKLREKRKPRKATLKENAIDLDKAGDDFVAGGGENCPFCENIYKKHAILRALKSRVFWRFMIYLPLRKIL